jgi:hypothetical protein
MGEPGGKWATQEDMSCENLSDQPKISYTLYNVHRANKMAYFNLPNSLRFIENQKIPVQNMVDKEIHFVKAILNRIP